MRLLGTGESRGLPGAYISIQLISTRSSCLSRPASLGSWWDSLRSLAPALRCYTSGPAEEFGVLFIRFRGVL